MARTVKIKFTAGGVGSSRPLTDQEIVDFKASIPKLKSEALSLMKAMILKGGFIFDPSLYGWAVEIENPPASPGLAWATRGILYVTVTFEDTYDDGKQFLMNKINQTGLLERDYYIVKNYS